MTAAPSPWPESVWASAVLRGLDARAQREIEAAGARLALRDGQRVFEVGEPADDLFVVEHGKVAVRAVLRGEEEARVLREAAAGESFGEDATLRTGGVRQAQAVSRGEARVVRIPAALLARAAERGGGGDDAARLARRRVVARNAMRDWLRAAAFGRALTTAEIELLLDAASHVALGRGEHLYHQGDPATHVYFVGDGLLQLQAEEGTGATSTRIRVQAYVARGDVLGETEVAGEPRRLSAVAMGSTALVAVDRAAFAEIAARNAELMDAVRRVTDGAEARGRVVAAQANVTSHVFQDIYRLQVARSLLVIDQESCVRCGHCAWSCATAHDDGISRLVRRGDKVTTRVAREEAPVEQVALLVPTSCQHCENPACMPDCPTGAIGRDVGGEVFIREELCTGCGACARGCPWDNIQLAPRTRTASAGPAARQLSAEVAVKCDLCDGRDAGPACVAACPTEAVVRIRPNEVLLDLREALGAGAHAAPLPTAAPAWPWVGGAALLALSAAVTGSAGAISGRDARLASGVLATSMLLALGAYAPIKRRLPARLRPHTVAHLAIGVGFVGVAFAHALPARAGSPLTAAMVWALAGSITLGIFGALVYRIVPARLTALERRAHLPEDLGRRAAELDEGAFGELTGKSDVVKALYRRLVGPYRASSLAALRLVASGRTLREEEARLGRRAAEVLGGRGEGKLEGLERVIRGAVERQALRAQRILTTLLRGWLIPHVVLAAVGLLLVAIHAVVAYGHR